MKQVKFKEGFIPGDSVLEAFGALEVVETGDEKVAIGIYCWDLYEENTLKVFQRFYGKEKLWNELFRNNEVNNTYKSHDLYPLLKDRGYNLNQYFYSYEDTLSNNASSSIWCFNGDIDKLKINKIIPDKPSEYSVFISLPRDMDTIIKMFPEFHEGLDCRERDGDYSTNFFVYVVKNHIEAVKIEVVDNEINIYYRWVHEDSPEEAANRLLDYYNKERSPLKFKLDIQNGVIYTDNPGLVIGRKGKRIKNICKILGRRIRVEDLRQDKKHSTQ